MDDTDDIDDQALAEIKAPQGHAPHSHWDEATREKAVALLALGTSIRKTARTLNVPYETLRKFRVSDDPAAQAARAEQLADTIAESWQVARLMLEKIKDAPVRSVAEAAVAFGILTEKSLLMEAHQEVAKGSPGKKTIMDWAALIRETNDAQRLRASVIPPRPSLPEITPPE